MEKRYVIGIDYGTLSGRAVLLDAENGKEIEESEFAYPHGVMDRELPCGKKLDDHFALQHPQDYLDVLRYVIRDVLAKSNISAECVAALGIDFTACTLIPLDEEGIPLCFKSEFEHEPHAYVKLWKHHAAGVEADEITELARTRGEKWLDTFGGRISSEWALPKILEILRKAPNIYHATSRFSEAGDWLSYILTGKESHAAAFSGYKALWRSGIGYPSTDFFASLDPELCNIVGTKLSTEISTVEKSAGHLNSIGAELTGLAEGTVLALPMIDAHAAMPAIGAVKPGDFVMIIGTSTCHLMHTESSSDIPGICGYVKDGVVPGCYTYEAGQACVGDSFAWFVDNCLPESYISEASRSNISAHKLLRSKADKLMPGESGLIVLDWFNGNRSILNRADLSGLILGLTLRTKPEEIYRALLEATAFGSRMILEQFEKNGLTVRDIYAAGGIAQKDPLLMQIYADVLGKPIHVSDAKQAGALGSAIYAAAAAGIYNSVCEASLILAAPCNTHYYPDTANQKSYDSLYAEYVELSNYFGKGENNIMRRLMQR